MIHREMWKKYNQDNLLINNSEMVTIEKQERAVLPLFYSKAVMDRENLWMVWWNIPSEEYTQYGWVLAVSSFSCHLLNDESVW